MVNGNVNGHQGHHGLRRDLTAGHAEGAAYGGMVGLGETYLPAFVLAVGLGEITAGLVASVPLLAGGIMQMISPVAVRRLASHKNWVLLCAVVQAASFAPLIAAAVGMRTVGVRPMSEAIDAPILPSLPDQAPQPVEDHSQAS